eukprot:TRINITY_DN82816_c0_g1_i1.p1 TRINITY_DN82816_c0_g1~~TRINITY_DN82816_c0_g1_i1.p1  ORF type:complete len:290 (+),score=71.83 TRINITY_DN82816_c0_g1_i1:120-989(+)
MSVYSPVIGVIGGTSLYKLEGLESIHEVEVVTPFGKPSAPVTIGVLEGIVVAFLPRHGLHHTFLPTEVPYRANVYALKSLGVRYILSVNAVGSLVEENKPGDVVFPEQFIDRTAGRPSTFFGEGCVAHVSMAHPVCPAMLDVVEKVVKEVEPEVRRGGTLVCIEGPNFSTKAESWMYRGWGGTLIGMTAFPECRLAKEAELAWCNMSLVTDYDCWHPDHDSVTTDMVMRNLQTCAEKAQKCVKAAILGIGQTLPRSSAHEELKFSIVTAKEFIPEETQKKLDLLIGKYL